jgi:hypothetical protein
MIKWFTDTPEATLLGARDTWSTVEIPEGAVCHLWVDEPSSSVDEPPSSLEFLRDCSDLKIDYLEINGHGGELDLNPIRELKNLRSLHLHGLEMPQKAWDRLACSSLETLSFSSSPLQELSLEFLRNFPKLKHLSLDGRELLPQQWLQVNELENLVSLKIWSGRSLYALPKYPIVSEIEYLHSLQNLEELEIDQPEFKDDFFEYLAPFPRLRSLKYSGGTFTQNGISNLLTHCPINELDLASAPYEGTLSGLDTASKAPLQHLSLRNFHLDDTVIQTLGQHKSLESISLTPADAQMRPLSLKPLTNLPNLSFLRLYNILLEEPNIFSNIPSLQQISLHQSMERPNTPSHRVPILGRPMVSPPVWQEIGELPHLRGLALRDTYLSDEDFVSLKNLGELEDLSLFERTLTPKGLIALTECKNLGSLVLYVKYLSPGIIKHLSKLPRLKEMRTYATELRPKDTGVLCELQNLLLFRTDYHLIFPVPLESIRKCLPHCYIEHCVS